MVSLGNQTSEGLVPETSVWSRDATYSLYCPVIKACMLLYWKVAVQARSQGGFDRTTLFSSSANHIKTYGKFIRTPPTLISRERRQDGRQTEGRDLYGYYDVKPEKSAVPVLSVSQEPVNFTAASYGPSSFAISEGKRE